MQALVFVFIAVHAIICGIEACGRSPLRIFNGDIVKGEPFPWMVEFFTEGYSGSARGACGGILLNNDTVLTAAHCFFKPALGSCEWPCYQLDQTGEQNLCFHQGKDLMTGENNFPNRKVLTKAHHLDNINPKFVRGISKVFGHPKYYPCRHGKDEWRNFEPYDAAIVKLDKPIENLEPICLHDFDCSNVVGEVLQAAGFGYNALVPGDDPSKPNKHYPRELREASFDVVQYLPQRNIFVTLPLGSKSQKITSGDSGSAFIKKHYDGKWYLYGIVSGYPNCVASYLDWVKKFL